MQYNCWSMLFQQSKLSTATLCSFLITMVGLGFLSFIFFTSEVGSKDLQLTKRGTHSYTAIQ